MATSSVRARSDYSLTHGEPSWSLARAGPRLLALLAGASGAERLQDAAAAGHRVRALELALAGFAVGLGQLDKDGLLHEKGGEGQAAVGGRGAMRGDVGVQGQREGQAVGG